jgi:hypothetical protein
MKNCRYASAVFIFYSSYLLTKKEPYDKELTLAI